MANLLPFWNQGSLSILFGNLSITWLFVPPPHLVCPRSMQPPSRPASSNIYNYTDNIMRGVGCRVHEETFPIAVLRDVNHVYGHRSVVACSVLVYHHQGERALIQICPQRGEWQQTGELLAELNEEEGRAGGWQLAGWLAG